MDGKIVATGITFDDVLLVPRYSAVVPAEVDVSTHLTRGIRLTIPLVSSPMDTVTESEMAIALAQEGGLGVIHKNLSIERQSEEVDKVKRSANGIIMDPVTLPPVATVARAREVKDQYNISGVPITADDRRLVGIITRRDLRFLESGETPVAEIMTKTGLVTATGTVSLDEAEKILMANKVEKLLLVDAAGQLTGLITIKGPLKGTRPSTPSGTSLSPPRPVAFCRYRSLDPCTIAPSDPMPRYALNVRPW